LPVPVHAAAMIGESMDENKATMTVMAKDRRILQSHYTLPSFSQQRQRDSSVWQIKSINLGQGPEED